MKSLLKQFNKHFQFYLNNLENPYSQQMEADHYRLITYWIRSTDTEERTDFPYQLKLGLFWSLPITFATTEKFTPDHCVHNQDRKHKEWCVGYVYRPIDPE